jgi:succinyl-CoA synthetase beta subunit
MKLFEYEGKKILSEYSIPIPHGKLVSQGDKLGDFHFPVVIKAQVLIGGRGKKGLIRLAENERQIQDQLSYLMGIKIENIPVHQVLIEEKLAIKQELYVSIFVDRTTKGPVITVGSVGGVDIEVVDRNKIFTKRIDPYIGLSNFLLREIIKKVQLMDKQLEKELARIITKLYQIYRDYEVELVEINPLVITKENQLIAADTKIILDNNALYRYPNLAKLNQGRDLTILEQEIVQLGASCVELKSGNIGVVTSGAGLLMTTVDTIEHWGGKVKVGVDIASIGFDKNTERMIQLLINLKKIPLKAVLLSFYLQIGRCDIFAQSINNAFQDLREKTSIIVRLKGNRANLAKKILSTKKFFVTDNFVDALKQVIEKSK